MGFIQVYFLAVETYLYKVQCLVAALFGCGLLASLQGCVLILKKTQGILEKAYIIIIEAFIYSTKFLSTKRRIRPV